LYTLIFLVFSMVSQYVLLESETTRENMVCNSCRTISMVVYALNPMSVMRFRSVILESSFR
jgi:hypothetical protein